MKTIKLFTLFAMLILATSCKKTTTNPGTPKQQISLRANGVLFSVTTGGAGVEEAYAHIRTNSSNSTVFQLDAKNADKVFFIGYLPITLSNGTYNAGKVAFNFAQWEDGPKLYSTVVNAKSRLQFTITKHLEPNLVNYSYVEGTFSGVLYNISLTDSVRITDGQIKIL